MPQLTSPPRTERPTTPSAPPPPPGPFPPWLASVGGFTVLVAASLWIPVLVTVVLGLAVLALSAVVLHRAAATTGAGGGHGLAGLVTAALGLLLAGTLSLGGGLAGDGDLDVDWTPPAGAAPAPAPDPAPPSPTTPTTTPEPVQLRPAAVEATGVAGPSVDGAGDAVTFEPSNVVDGRPDTAWRVDGDGVGHTLTFRFDRTVHILAIGLLPGYAKVDPVSGTDRFPQNRRVTTATYHFDSSPPAGVRFTDAPELQWLEVGADTTEVVVEITGSTEAAERDYTAIAEVQFTGWPTG